MPEPKIVGDASDLNVKEARSRAAETVAAIPRGELYFTDAELAAWD